MTDDKKETEASEATSRPEEVPKTKDRDVKQAEIQAKSLETDIDHLNRLLDEEKKRGEGYLTRVKYLQADFDNYRKRVDREVKEIEEFSTTKLVLKLLPVMDELELAVVSAEASKDSKSIAEGLKMILKNLTIILEGEGLKHIEAVGKPFNPALHEAVDKVQGKKGREDVVIEEVRRGFIFRDRVMRPTMVKVELAPRPQNRNTGTEGEVSEHEQ